MAHFPFFASSGIPGQLCFYELLNSVVRTRFVSTVLILAFGLVSCHPASQRADSFSESGLLYGTRIARDQCPVRDNAVWVQIDDRGECIRYYHSGLSGKTDIAVANFYGDIGRVNLLHRHVVRVPAFYAAMSASGEWRKARALGRQLGLPYLQIARPGTLGSSGNHGERYGLRDKRVMNASLDAIKKKHHIGRWALSGQSGGGYTVGALLTMRGDVSCASLASTPGAMKESLLAKDHGWFMENMDALVYDPFDHVAEIPRDGGISIYVIGDEKDTVVRFRSQKSYYQALHSRGHDVHLIALKGRGPSNHGLARAAILATAMCAQGGGPEQVLETVRVNSLDKFRSQANAIPDQMLPTPWGSFSATWEGTKDPLPGRMVYGGNRRLGTLVIGASAGIACEGGWEREYGSYREGRLPSGNWYVACPNGRRADGRFQSDLPGHVRAWGEDTEGHRVAFEF